MPSINVASRAKASALSSLAKNAEQKAAATIRGMKRLVVCYPCCYPSNSAPTKVSASALHLVNLLGFSGGRTRARTWDPLIKSQLTEE